VSRGEQRRRYDERRADVLPRHGYSLVVLEVDEFAHDRAKRLLRLPQDEAIVRQRLQSFIA
jgi:very-short-patch-repair endonuclease